MVEVEIIVFFSSRRRHTRYWRDWSSDVCSSDLYPVVPGVLGVRAVPSRVSFDFHKSLPWVRSSAVRTNVPATLVRLEGSEKGRASRDRKSVVLGKECRSRWSPYH